MAKDRRDDAEAMMSAWRATPPTREQLMAAASLCHLAYWWDGPTHRSWETLREDAMQMAAPAELAPTREARGVGSACEFQDRDQVHRCVQTVMEFMDPNAMVTLYDDRINAAVIREPNRIVVFFRGMFKPQDMINDCHLKLVPNQTASQETGDDSIRVRSSFRKHADTTGGGARLLSRVLAIIETQAFQVHRGKMPCEVLITGHGLGAAAATLLALAIDVQAAEHPCIITLVTFGLPRVGNRAFAEQVDGSTRLRHWRVQNELDVVTRLPWWLPYPGAYKHTGHHIWLANGRVTWKLDGAIRSASHPMNVLTYPLRCLCSTNAADVKVHRMSGNGAHGYREHLEEFDWQIAPQNASEEDKGLQRAISFQTLQSSGTVSRANSQLQLAHDNRHPGRAHSLDEHSDEDSDHDDSQRAEEEAHLEAEVEDPRLKAEEEAAEAETARLIEEEEEEELRLAQEAEAARLEADETARKVTEAKAARLKVEEEARVVTKAEAEAAAEAAQLKAEVEAMAAAEAREIVRRDSCVKTVEVTMVEMSEDST